MTVLVLINTFALCVTAVLVAGLLRAHGDSLETLAELNRASRPGTRLAPGVPTPPDRQTPSAVDVHGSLATGGSVTISFSSGGPNTVLAFLSSGCLTCHAFWEAFQPDVRQVLPGGARLILVTNDSDRESPSKLSKLSPPDLPVVMSSAAWEAYEVPAAPYFVYIDGVSGRVHGEGSAQTWPQVVSLLTDALFDAESARDKSVAGSPDSSAAVSARDPNYERNIRADAALRAAGISPDDPSFWELPARGGGRQS